MCYPLFDIAHNHDSALCSIAQNHVFALGGIAQHKNGIAPTNSLKLGSLKSGFKQVKFGLSPMLHSA
jgi:hypothetical protein